jgi:hypothetical protein
MRLAAPMCTRHETKLRACVRAVVTGILSSHRVIQQSFFVTSAASCTSMILSKFVLSSSVLPPPYYPSASVSNANRIWETVHNAFSSAAAVFVNEQHRRRRCRRRRSTSSRNQLKLRLSRWLHSACPSLCRPSALAVTSARCHR